MAVDDLARVGALTLQSRVERWESDFNRHWNVRFYARSFQLAAEVIAVRAGGANPGAATTVSRQIRFHRELFVGAPVTVRSMRVAPGAAGGMMPGGAAGGAAGGAIAGGIGGGIGGAIVHVLSSEGRLAATAVDLPGCGAEVLPAVAAGELGLALPRGIDGGPHVAGTAPRPGDRVVDTGPVRPGECDHTGALLAEDLFRRSAIASHDFLAGLGFTTDYVAASGVSRMSIEVKMSRHGDPAPGALVLGRSRLTGVGRKNFTVRHWLEQACGTPVATIEQCLVAVDLTLRRAVEVPAFLQAARAGGLVAAPD